MKRSIIIGLLVVGVASGAYYLWNGESPAAATQAGAAAQGGRGRQGGGGGFGGPGGGFGGFGGGGPRLPMTVEVGAVKRADMSQQLTVVGNLIGAATVETVPKVSGRLEAVSVRMGDRVSRGQRLATIEDSELLEQIKQAKASFDVTSATIRQREADLRLAQTNLERTRSLFERELIPKPQLHGMMSQDFSVGFGAEVEQQAKAFDQLRTVLILALVLVYAVMASQYESLRDPFIIMFSVPTAAIGVVLSLKLTGTSFNMQAYIGIIMLAGIVVSNGLLLVDYTNVLRRRDKMPLRQAVEVAGRTRLRPILMTSIATALGLVPMSLGIGEGSELQVPLARVVIGGLTTSLLITLVLVPTVYTLFEEGWHGLWTKHPETEAQV